MFSECCILFSSLVKIKYRFRPRILIDVSKIDMATTVLGFKISMPIMIAPTAMQKMAHPEGKQQWRVPEFMTLSFDLCQTLQMLVREKQLGS